MIRHKLHPKETLIIALILILCSGFDTIAQRAAFRTELQGVQRGGDANAPSEKDTSITNDTFTSTYTDELVEVEIEQEGALRWFYIIITNKTTRDISINWREAIFIDEENRRNDVLPNDARLKIDYWGNPTGYTEDSVLERHIAPGETRKQTIIPFTNFAVQNVDNASYSITDDGIETEGINHVQSFGGFPSDPRDKLGYEYDIWLPIKIGEYTAKYVFNFRIVNVLDLSE